MGGVGVDRRRFDQAPAAELAASSAIPAISTTRAARKGIDSRFFYSRLISDFWDAKAGVSFTVFDQGVTRSGFIAGVEGLAPYGIHVDAVLGVSQTGVVSARLDASYDVMLSQKLIAQPYLEAMLASQNDPGHPARQRAGALRGRASAALRDRQGVRALYRRELRAVHRQHRGLRGGGRRADLAGARAGRAEVLVLRRMS